MSTPLLIYLDNVEVVTLAFGLMGKIDDTLFRQISPGANKKFSLVVYENKCKWEIRKPYHESAALGQMQKFEDGFYQSCGEKSWFHALQKYAVVYQKEHGIEPKTNERMYEPQFCTWRVVNSDKLTHDWTVATAKECRKLGIGTLILDDGWYGPGLDSDIMISDLGNWPSSIPSKYPSITKTVQEIKKQGVHPVLWYCPTGIGPQSDLYESSKKYCVVENGKLYKTPALFHSLCPRNPNAREIIRTTLRKVLSYGADGFKPDLFNYMPITPCEADHEHDIPTVLEAIRACFKMMYEEAIKYDPNMIFMAKNDEANVDFCQFAPAVRAGDSPYDPNIMFLRCAYASAFAPVIINDYLMLAGPESPEEIARCMIKQVTIGTPAVAIDLLTLAADRKKVLATWIKLYNQELRQIHKAARIEPQNSSLTCWQRIDENSKIGIISVLHPCDTIGILPSLNRLFILNATANDELFIRKSFINNEVSVKCFDFEHQLQKEYRWKNSLTIRVPKSGYCEITNHIS